MYIPNIIIAINTTTVDSRNSLRVGQVAFFSSVSVSLKKSLTLLNGFAINFLIFKIWQGRRGSNPQLAVLETAALPIELLP